MSYKQTKIDHSDRITVVFHRRIIASLRQTMGYTQQQLADKAKTSRSYLAKVESGQRRIPSREFANNLGDALNVDFVLDYRFLDWLHPLVAQITGVLNPGNIPASCDDLPKT